MPHMLAQEHMGIVNALQYGLTRDYATIAAALAAIGSAQAMLLIPYTGDGVWTLNTNITFPSNVTVYEAPGVTYAGTANMTFNGQRLSYSPLAFTAMTGTVTFNYVATQIGGLQVQKVGIGAAPLTPLHIVCGSVTAPQIEVRLEDQTTAHLAKITFTSSGALRANLGLQGSADFVLGLANTADFIVTGGNMGIGLIPSLQFQLSNDSAGKPGSSSWSVVSDSRTKTVQGDYADGLPLIRDLPTPKRFKYNGLAGTPNNNVEYIGFIAQEVTPVAPYMVKSYSGKLNPEDVSPTDIFYTDTGPLAFALVNAVKTLDARLTGRVVSMANATSFTPTSDTADINTQVNTQASGTLTANAPSGTPTDGQQLLLRIKSTNSQTYAWHAIYRAGTDLALPVTHAGAGKTEYMTFRYHAADAKWDLFSSLQGY